MSEPENPPAFPLAVPTDFQFANNGMSLRDYFASQVDVATYNPVNSFEAAHGKRPSVWELADYISSIRYIEADRMLAKRLEDK